MRGTRSALPVLVPLALLLAACGSAVGPSTGAPSATSGSRATPVVTPAAESPTTPAPSSARPAAAATPTPSPSEAAAPSGEPTPAPRPTRTSAPSPDADTPTPDTFWDDVERGMRDAGRVAVEIAGPNAGTLRFEPDASATAIEGVVGYVCLEGRSYDGQSGFTRVPGRWTCGAGALVAGFRGIGQPIDAWNSTIPTDTGRRESLTVNGPTWTWRYRATSPFYGGDVRVTVTLDTRTRRITAARRVDPTGVTRYTFTYGAKFPPIAVPR